MVGYGGSWLVMVSHVVAGGSWWVMVGLVSHVTVGHGGSWLVMVGHGWSW